MNAFKRVSSTALLSTAVVAIACTEPVRTPPPEPPAPRFEAQLELSDSAAVAGATVTATLRLHGKLASPVASFTARIAYDSLGLRFVEEVARSDGATRAINPQPGLVRVAGIAPKGFADGTLEVIRFTVLRPAALYTVAATIDEMHTAVITDAAASLARRVP